MLSSIAGRLPDALALTLGRVPFVLALLCSVTALGSWPRWVCAQEQASQDIPTIEARFTRILSSDSMTVASAAISPDGRWMAFSSFRGDTGDIWVVPTAGGDPIRLTNGRHLNDSPQWFPSGDRIAFLSDRVTEGQGLMLYVMSIPIDPETGRAAGPTRQVSLEPARYPSISPDGRWIAYGTYMMRGALRVIPSRGGAARTLFDRDGTSPVFPAWSADSREVYFAIRDPDSERRRLMRVSVDGGEATEVSVIQGPLHGIAPYARYLVREVEGSGRGSPRLELMSQSGRLLGRVPLHRDMSAASLTAEGDRATAVVRDIVSPIFVAPVSGGPPRQVSEARTYESVLGWTPDNRQVFSRTQLNGRDAVLLTPAEGGPALEIPLPVDAEDPIVPSTDGQYLAYALGARTDTGRTVLVRRISDGETRVLTDAFAGGLRLGGAILGPGGTVTDGEEFLYLERYEDRVELRASHPEGPSRLIRAIPMLEWRLQGRSGPSFGIHGDWLASSVRHGDSTKLVLSIAGEEDHALATVPGRLGRVYWSHDGRWIVAGRYTPDGQGFQFDLLLVGVTPDGTPASEPQFLETEAWVSYFAQWLPDNETIAVFGMTKEGMKNRLWLNPIRQGESAVSVTWGDPSGIWSAVLSPDGRQVAYGQEIRRGSSIWVLDYGEFLKETGIGER